MTRERMIQVILAKSRRIMDEIAECAVRKNSAGAGAFPSPTDPDRWSVRAMKIVDDRTPEEKTYTHKSLVFGLDTFLSGWGGAAGGKSYAAWACRDEDAETVKAWVKKRGDMKNVSIADGDFRPSGGRRDHFHIYVVRENHPSLRGDE